MVLGMRLVRKLEFDTTRIVRVFIGVMGGLFTAIIRSVIGRWSGEESAGSVVAMFYVVYVSRSLNSTSRFYFTISPRILFP
jgi:hypothetical protein